MTGDDGQVQDLAGNVWEWMASPYSQDYSESNQSVMNIDSGDVPRVLRGGSWYNEPGGAAVGRARQVRPARRVQLRRVPSGQDRNPLTFLLFPFTGVQGAEPPGRVFLGYRNPAPANRPRYAIPSIARLPYHEVISPSINRSLSGGQL